MKKKPTPKPISPAQTKKLATSTAYYNAEVTRINRWLALGRRTIAVLSHDETLLEKLLEAYGKAEWKVSAGWYKGRRILSFRS